MSGISSISGAYFEPGIVGVQAEGCFIIHVVHIEVPLEEILDGPSIKEKLFRFATGDEWNIKFITHIKIIQKMSNSDCRVK